MHIFPSIALPRDGLNIRLQITCQKNFNTSIRGPRGKGKACVRRRSKRPHGCFMMKVPWSARRFLLTDHENCPPLRHHQLHRHQFPYQPPSSGAAPAMNFTLYQPSRSRASPALTMASRLSPLLFLAFDFRLLSNRCSVSPSVCALPVVSVVGGSYPACLDLDRCL